MVNPKTIEAFKAAGINWEDWVKKGGSRGNVRVRSLLRLLCYHGRKPPNTSRTCHKCHNCHVYD